MFSFTFDNNDKDKLRTIGDEKPDNKNVHNDTNDLQKEIDNIQEEAKCFI